MTYFRSVRASGIDPILLDGGDFLFDIKDRRHKAVSYRRQMIEKAKVIIESYNRFGYRAAAVAECELVYGIEVLKKLQKNMKFPLLCANLVDASGKTAFQPSHVFEQDGVRVGVVSVLMPLRKTYLEKTAPGHEITPPLPALEEEVARLADDVDIFFILGHVNRPDVETIAKEFKHIDFVLEPNSYSGNDTTWIQNGDRFTARNGRVLLKIDGQGAHVGRLDVEFQGKNLPWVNIDAKIAEGTSVNRCTGSDVELGPQIGRNAAIRELTQKFIRSTRFVAVDEEQGFQASTDYLTGDTCKACHPDQHKAWEKTGHARAYATLEKTGDEFRYDCIPCHVLAYGETFLEAGQAKKNKNVQCESCHGTNPLHPTNPEKFAWEKVNDKACWGCHNPRVTRAPFYPGKAFPKIKCPPLPGR